jgi:hypothetical protein
MSKEVELDRRHLMFGAGGLAAATAAMLSQTAAAQTPGAPPTGSAWAPPKPGEPLPPLPPRVKHGGDAKLIGPNPIKGPGVNADDPALLKGRYLDLNTQRGNREAFARLQGSLDFSKSKYGWYTGKAFGVRPGEAVRDLFGFTGFSVARLEPNDGEVGGYKKILREVGYYTDLKTGEIIEEWRNPYFNETVKVVPIANDPFNIVISDWRPEPPSYGGLNQNRPPRQPLQLPWTRRGDVLNLFSHINLFYPSALNPRRWPRESGSPFAQVTEIFLYNIDWADMQNPRKKSVEYNGTWNRITPWLPWMLMGETPGNICYAAYMGAYDDINRIDRKVLDYTAKHFPQYLEAPAKWEEPSHSSLEWYSRSQTPAPLRADGVNAAPPPELPGWMKAMLGKS